MNQEHFNILTESIKHWNDWRSANHRIKPDLSGANLRGFNLFQANLDDTDLSEADLREAVFIRGSARLSNFSNADMEGAQLQGTNFNRSNFSNTNLRAANLLGTIFTGCSLLNADLTGADCTGAHFENSNLLNTTFYDCKVKGANFEFSNVQEANLFSDQFKDAVISLESLGGVEKKQKTGLQYAYLFIVFSLVIIFFFMTYVFIFKTEDVGTGPAKIKAVLYAQVGSIAHAVGMEDKAKYFLGRAVHFHPKYGKAHYLLGDIFRKERNHKEAVRHYSKYIKLSPPSESTRGLGVYISTHQKYYDEIKAEEELKKKRKKKK